MYGITFFKKKKKVMYGLTGIFKSKNDVLVKSKVFII